MSTEKETKLEQNLDKPKDSDESQKNDYADWKLVQPAIEHENTLVNHRLSWLGTLQGLLFTAFGVILNAYVSNGTKSIAYFFLLLVIGLLGIFICFFLWITLKQARTQLRKLTCWWYSEDRSKLADKDYWYKLIKHDPSEDSEVKKLPKYPPLHIYRYRSHLIPDFIPKFIIKCFNDYNIPLLFIIGWVIILTIVWLWI